MLPMFQMMNKPIIRVALIATVCFMVPSDVFADSVDDTYAERFKALKRDDLRGHLELAKWVRDQDRWDLVSRSCTHILRQEPNHKFAKLLLEQARARLGKDDRDQRKKPSSRKRGGRSRSVGDPPRLLTHDEIQRIRRAEFEPDIDDRVNIRIDRKMLKAFAESMKGSIEFPYDNRRDFFRDDRVEQASLMLRLGSKRHREGVGINGDPERIKGFDRTVVPYVQPNCATSDCHGGVHAGKFRILGGRSLSNSAMYTNFYLLHEYVVGGERLINRKAPERSLLLTYGLPPTNDPEFKGLSHPAPSVAAFEDKNDPEYRAVLSWLKSLDLTSPDYGIDLNK